MGTSKRTPFKKLTEPGRIGELKLRNRVIMPPIGTGYASRDGYVTDRMMEYYQQRAKSGVGLVIVEATTVEPRAGRLCIGEDGMCGLRIDHDKFIPRLSELARAIQRCGASAAIQLVHSGREAKSSVTGVQPVAPSAIRRLGEGLLPGEVPKELTVSEIKDIVTCFARAARRAKEAGFEGVELHAAHYYLIAEFISPETNERRDDYGGSFKNRMRFLIEIIRAVKESAGKTYPVWCRINGGGTGIAASITPDELKAQVRALEQSGVDAVSISGMSPVPSYLSPPTPLLPFARVAKQAARIPVITAGAIDFEPGESILKEGSADFISMGRALIVDPDYLKKFTSGKTSEIAPCTRCLMCNDSILVGFGAGPMKCMVNATVGEELGYPPGSARQVRRVVVVGGGPAGMEAARIAAARGHRVTLFDENSELGGQMVPASKPPHKERIAALTAYLEGQIRRLDVEVKLGVKVDATLVSNLKPDVVILATGSVSLTPDIPGIKGSNVITATDVLSGKMKAGEAVAVIGGELIGCETALFLAEQGKKLTLARRGAEMAAKLTPRVREPLLQILTEHGIAMLTGVTYHEINDKGLVITDRQGKRQIISADTVVLAAGALPNRELLEALKDIAPEVYLAGDCVRPGTILNAIHDGFRIAYRL